MSPTLVRHFCQSAKGRSWWAVEEVEGVVQLGWVPGNFFFYLGPILGLRKLLPDEGQDVLHVPQPCVMLLLRQCFTYSSVCLSAL